MGWTLTAAAGAAGVSRATASKWVRRYRGEGLEGMGDRPRRPRRPPRALPRREVRRTLGARRRMKVGPHRLASALGLPRSTIYGVLRRHGLSRLGDADRPSGVPVRCCRKRPGELLAVDADNLARIPAGGGHRGPRAGATVAATPPPVGTTTSTRPPATTPGWPTPEVLPDERGETCASFLLRAGAFFAEPGVGIREVMTDGALSSTRSAAFSEALGARHLTTGPYNPALNGKAERFGRTLAQERAYARLYRSNEERARALPRWLYHDNHRRPHTALGGLTPMQVLVNDVGGNHSYVRAAPVRPGPPRGGAPAPGSGGTEPPGPTRLPPRAGPPGPPAPPQAPG